MIARANSAIRLSGTSTAPSASMITAVGKMPRTRSGPPVAESSSAAS
ncbi:Uncharacterised protein [Mycobacterium tuberculosis]|nr:Uncharacterised protein [Mycobacterium tuberculosis]